MSKYSLNKAYFDTITTPEQAYWLGFFSADGYVSKYGKQIELSLAVLDGDHVERFAQALEYTGPIRPAKGNRRLLIASAAIVEALGRLGVSNAKSFTLEPWVGPPDLMRHYWRGMVDGDGTLSIRPLTKRHALTARLHLCGSRPCVETFGQFIHANAEGPYNVGRIEPNGSIWQVAYGGIRPVQSVVKVLYQDGDVALPRKAELARRVLEMELQPTTFAHLTRDDLLPRFTRLGSWAAVADELKVSPTGIYRHLRKLGIPVETRIKRGRTE